jgi:5-methylcytosine-specific restriction endonuclease McrA
MKIWSRTETLMSLWAAQDKRCGVCDSKMFPATIHHECNGWTIEHVFPRSRYRGLVGNTFVSHRRCNQAKGDRRPTGCEILMLFVVNARLGRHLRHRHPDRAAA